MAIQQLGPYWSEATAAQLRITFGWATCTLVQQVYNDAVNYPVDWSKHTLATAQAAAQAALQQAYTWLVPESCNQLAACFAYSWK